MVLVFELELFGSSFLETAFGVQGPLIPFISLKLFSSCRHFARGALTTGVIEAD
jgi:hypothetical protein